MRTYAQLTTSFVVFCNRVGVDESISFWGGSRGDRAVGRALFSAPLYDEGLFLVDIDSTRYAGSASRRRCCATSGRSCGQRVEPDRGRAGRPGPGLDGATRRPNPAWTWPRSLGSAVGAGRGPRMAPADPRRVSAGRARRRWWRGVGGPACFVGLGSASDDSTGPSPVRGTVRGPAPMARLATSAGRTDWTRRCREVADEDRTRYSRSPRSCPSTPTWLDASSSDFIRAQLPQAGFERALVLGLSGGIDSALVAYLVGRGRSAPEQPAVRADALRERRRRSRWPTPRGRGRLGCRP